PPGRGRAERPTPALRPKLLSELEALRKENELLKVNLRVVLEKVRLQKAEIASLKVAGKATSAMSHLGRSPRPDFNTFGGADSGVGFAAAGATSRSDPNQPGPGSSPGALSGYRPLGTPSTGGSAARDLQKNADKRFEALEAALAAVRAAPTRRQKGRR